MLSLKRTLLPCLRYARLGDYTVLNVVSGVALVKGRPLSTETKFSADDRIYAEGRECVLETDGDLVCEDLPKTECAVSTSRSVMIYMHDYEPAFLCVTSGHVECRGQIMPPNTTLRMHQDDTLLTTLGDGEAAIEIYGHRQLTTRAQGVNTRLKDILTQDLRDQHQQWLVYTPNCEPAWILKSYLERLHPDDYRWDFVDMRDDVVTFHATTSHHQLTKFFAPSPHAGNVIVYSPMLPALLKKAQTLCPRAFMLTDNEIFYQAHKSRCLLLPTVPKVERLLPMCFAFEPEKWVLGVLREEPASKLSSKRPREGLEAWHKDFTPKRAQKWGLCVEKPSNLSVAFEAIWSAKGTSAPISRHVYVLMQ